MLQMNFKLPNWRVRLVEEFDHEHRIHAEYLPRPTHCPHCTNDGAHVRFGKRAQRFRDLPARGKPVCILVLRRRYLCKNCGKTFFEALPDMDAHHRATKRLLIYIREEAHRRSLVSIAAEVGLSEGSIRNIRREWPVSNSASTVIQVGATNDAAS
jgi:transposase